jgi:hypothetical protein
METRHNVQQATEQQIDVPCPEQHSRPQVGRRHRGLSETQIQTGPRKKSQRRKADDQM